MSIAPSGVKFDRVSRNRLILFGLLAAEVVLSAFLYMSLAAHLIWPEKSQGVVGVAKVLSYEGRLTDSSGNPLGGTGTNYCFRFSIYDSSTGGSKLWPSGTPATTTISVVDGVFDAQIGSADSLTYNFYDNDTVYLNVDVNNTSSTCTGAWESLGQRQRIQAAGYAITAANVYSDLIKTDISNSRVQIGTGTGSANPKLLAMDVKNTSDTIGGACSPSGTMWYNSSSSRALVCDNGTIQEVGNLATIVGIKEQGAGSAITSGTVNFSAMNRLSISQNAQTLRFSVSDGINAFGLSNIGNTAGNTGTQTGTFVLSGQANITLSQVTGVGGVHTIGISAPAGGGGGGVRQKIFYNFDTFTSIASIGANTTHNTNWVIPMNLAGSMSLKTIGLLLSRSAGTTLAQTIQLGVYTLNGSTLSQSTSTAEVFSLSASTQWSAPQLYRVTGLNAVELTPGQYWIAARFLLTTGSVFVLGRNTAGSITGIVNPGTNQVTQNSSAQTIVGAGTYSTNTLPQSMALSGIRGGGATGAQTPYIMITEIP